jgi:hypothetical protein
MNDFGLFVKPDLVRDGMKSGMILKSKLKSVTTSRVAPERGK